MYKLLLALLILDGLVLTAVVLLQSGQGGGLASMGGGQGTENLIGGRQAVTLLTKMTWITGGTFLGLALLLSVLSSRDATRGSILRDQFQQNAPATAPATGAPAPAPGVLPGTQPNTNQTPAPATTPAATPPATTTTGQ